MRSPGPAASGGRSEEEIFGPIATPMALGRIVTDDEVARVVLFLASDCSMAMTGAILDANGVEFIAT